MKGSESRCLEASRREARACERSPRCGLQERRRALKGYLPERRVRPTVIKLPGDEVYAPLMEFIADNRMHAVSIKTYTPAEWARDRKLNGF